MPRFAAVNLDRGADGPKFPEVVDRLQEDDGLRVDFLKACLTKLGLTVNRDEHPVPSLSRLHLSSLRSSDVSALRKSLRDIIVVDDGEEYIKGEHDTFHLQKSATWSTGNLSKNLDGKDDGKTDDEPLANDRILDYSEIVKHVLLHEDELPPCKETASFNHHAFYSNLKAYQATTGVSGAFGRYLLFGEVVTSTSTMLEKSDVLSRIVS